MTCKNFLLPNNFKFQVTKLATLTDYIQAVDFPGIFLGVTEGVPNPFQTVPEPGEHMDYEDITVTFKLDEDLEVYTEISDWIEAMGKPTNFGQYAALNNKPVSDGTLTILDSQGNSKLNYTFLDLYPQFLSGFKLNYTLNEVTHVTADVLFKYRQYTHKVVT